MDQSVFDEPEDLPTPDRSPSRLDFCMEDLESSEVLSDGMDWASVFPNAFIDEGAFAVDIAPLGPPIVNSQRSADSHTHEIADASRTPDVPPESPVNQVIIDPQAPVPVRPPSVQLEFDPQEHTPPPRATAQRLNYPHHGFSRSALLQQKTFWNSRHEEWAEWKSHMEESEAHKQESMKNDAYTGLNTARQCVVESPPPYMRTPPSGLERDHVNHPQKQDEQDIHSSIYPRVGDISALRDPYSVNIDRCFFRYPLWTLHKMLYVFNMNHRSAPFGSQATVSNTAEFHSSASSSTLSSYTSSVEDDEGSDSTLVGDRSPVARPHPPSERLDGTLSPYSFSPWKRWELSWYARWELLIGLFQHDHTKYHALNTSTKFATSPEYKEAASPVRMFRFTVQEDEEDVEDDEEEDYGTIISNSSFRVDLEEECERALAFYSRESR